ncbi:hypothetical protein GCM10022406_40530 [Hymenobacter algoricola]|uniref:Uncharacterized protein n=1 Tax=Hymenobacter algoricola TaxID=486267 RepID=A0ABP7NWV7_9BACT
MRPYSADMPVGRVLKYFLPLKREGVFISQEMTGSGLRDRYPVSQAAKFFPGRLTSDVQPDGKNAAVATILYASGLFPNKKPPAPGGTGGRNPNR